jgi:hypothetical protein
LLGVVACFPFFDSLLAQLTCYSGQCSRILPGSSGPELAAELAKIYEMTGNELLAQEWAMKTAFEDDGHPD